MGVFIERVSGQSLGAYFQTHIFQPLDMHNTAFVTKGSMRQKLAGMHHRSDDGALRRIPNPFKPARTETNESEIFHSGGGGLLSTAPDYCRKHPPSSPLTPSLPTLTSPLPPPEILATLLNNGLSPHTHARILHPRTIDQMFIPQLPDWEAKYAAAGYPVSRPDLVNVALRDGLPVTGRQGWGLNFLLEGDALQRGSAPGLSNCWWGVDRERGVGGVLLSQILPFGDPVVAPLWGEVWGRLYKGEGEVGG